MVEKCVIPNYEQMYGDLERKFNVAEAYMEELRSINNHLQKELDIYKAKWSAVELIFGNGGVK